MIATAPTAFRFAIAFAAMLMLMASTATAQKAIATPPPATDPDPVAPSPDTAPPKADNPGLLNELGKLLVKPGDLFPSLKPADTAAPIATPTQPGDTSVAAPSAPAIPAPVTTGTAPATAPTPGLVPQMVRGRASCPVASNGAPDCKAGADKLCREKGFSNGNGLDMDSARTCSTKALLDGARHIRDICRTETFVTRAMCQ